MADISDDFYVDSIVILTGLLLGAWGVITRDTTLISIACLVLGAGAYEMYQRITNF